MTGGTLVLSRDVKLHTHYKTLLEAAGFKNVTVTASDGDTLNRLINELKPRLVLADSVFYQVSTPYMLGLLLKLHPGLTIAAVSVGPSPAGLAAQFYANGVESCVCWTDGAEQFRKGLERVRDGGIFVSCSVQERIEAMYEYPEPAGNITGRHIEVAVLACNGKTNRQIAETLNVSISTVNNHLAKIYYTLGVHNKSGLIGAGMSLGVIEWDGKCFHAAGSGPGPGKKTTVRRIV